MKNEESFVLLTCFNIAGIPAGNSDLRRCVSACPFSPSEDVAQYPPRGEHRENQPYQCRAVQAVVEPAISLAPQFAIGKQQHERQRCNEHEVVAHGGSYVEMQQTVYGAL